jgi:uncharacterized protein
MTSVITFERCQSTPDVRAAGRRLVGHAALFNSTARIGSSTESIRADAFNKSLSDKSDILALVDHDASRVLGRTKSGTLRLSQDSKGLAFDLDVPDTTAGRDILALAERGDLGGMSFGFRMLDEQWTGSHRELRSLELVEISVVQAFPAYDGTTVAARSHGLFLPRSVSLARLQLQARGIN